MLFCLRYLEDFGIDGDGFLSPFFPRDFLLLLLFVIELEGIVVDDLLQLFVLLLPLPLQLFLLLLLLLFLLFRLLPHHFLKDFLLLQQLLLDDLLVLPLRLISFIDFLHLVPSLAADEPV